MPEIEAAPLSCPAPTERRSGGVHGVARVAGGHNVPLGLVVNGCAIQIAVDPATTLLDLIRDQLGLTGTKKGCDMGACGACTILVAGRRIVACLALAASYDGAEVTTIEGIGTPEALHPLQAAFIRHDALQCGYCTPGQILAGIAVLADRPASVDEIKDAMSGNLCRCGAQPNVIAAIAELAGL